VEHALVEYQEVYVFWSRLYQVLEFSQYSRPDTRSILLLHIARNRRSQLNVKAYSLAIACGLWVIHRSRLCSHFSQTHPPSILTLLSEWKWMVHGSVCWISPTYLYQLNYNHVFLQLKLHFLSLMLELTCNGAYKYSNRQSD
jgi:hypothetical protein